MTERGLARKKERPHSQSVKGNVKLGQIHKPLALMSGTDHFTVVPALMTDRLLLTRAMSLGNSLDFGATSKTPLHCREAQSAQEKRTIPDFISYPQ